MESRLCLLLSGVVLIASCGTSCASQEKGKVKQTAAVRAAGPAASEQPSPVNLKLVTVRDPVENAYTIGMPEGWANRTYSARVFDIHSTVDITVSPNGSVLIFAGDPSIPQYWSPQAANDMTRWFASVNPKMRIEPFRPADEFFESYVKRKFGKLPEFKLSSVKRDAEAEQALQKKFNDAGVNLRATSARVAFTYKDGAKPMKALILGYCADGGSIWIPTVCGITTTGEPETYLPMIEAMGKSRKTNPEWTARRDQLHQQAMAQIQQFGQMLTDQHKQNMAWIQQSAQRHQMRMQALQSQADASTKAFNDRMASGDAQHRGFLNYINDENTVASPDGKTFQVDSGYQRYFVHRTDRTYIGGDINMDLDKLRRLNLNPDDYEEVKIQR